MSDWLDDGLRLLATAEFAAVEHKLAAPELGRDRADWEHLAGSLALARKDVPKAVEHFKAALLIHPDRAVVHHALGAALRTLGQLEAALVSLKRATELAHDYVDAWLDQGEAGFELGDHELARDCFEIALVYAPDDVRALLGVARILRSGNAPEEAIAYLQRALRTSQNSAELYFELGLCSNRTGNTGAALDSYRRAIELESDHHAAMANLGLIYLAQLGDAASAQQWFQRAIKLQPDSVAAQANLGLALQEQGQFEAALAHYDHLVAAHPTVIEYRWNRALTHLYKWDFARGWPDYELRHTRTGRDVRPRFPLPNWDGGNLNGRQLLVYGEQGVGDEIMFASCIPDLLRRANSVVLESDARLAKLFQRSFPSIIVHGGERTDDYRWLRAYPGLERQIAIGSLPRFFRATLSDFPKHTGHLVADPDRTAFWKSRLSAGGKSLNVGLSWRGGTSKSRQELRSLAFDRCLPWLTSRRCQFVCLQRGDCTHEVATARRHGVELGWWPEAIQEIDELAALIASLDLVVSVDNTIAHLAGALGQRTWILLPYAPDWRYGWHGESMPWYAAMRLYRQTRPGDWQPVIETVTAELGRSECC